MIEFVIRLDSVTLDNITDVCNLRGCKYVTFSSFNGKLSISAITSEYMMVLARVDTTEIAEDFSIRIPTSALKPMLWTGDLLFRLDTSLIISLVYNQRVQSKVKLPLELDFDQDLLKEVLEAHEKSLSDPSVDLYPLLSLKEISSFSKDGIQVENKLAFVAGSGFVVYLPVNFDFKGIMSKECLSSMLSFIRTSQDLKLTNITGYHLISKNNLIFSWRKSRVFAPTDYDTFKNLEPIGEFRCDLTSTRQMVRAIPIVKTKVYKAHIDLSRNFLQIEVGNHENFLAVFKSDIVIPGKEEVSLDITLPYSILRTVLSSSQMEWSNVLVSIYETCIAFRSGDTTIVMIRGD